MTSLKRLTRPLLGLAGTVLVTSVMALPSLGASLSFTTSRADLRSNDRLDWASLGPIDPPQPFRVLPFASTATSDNGLQVNIDIPPTGDPTITPPLLFQTTAAGIATNFAPDDFVLFTGLDPTQFPAPGNPGPLSLSFETPVRAVGAQIAVDDTPMFDAFISAFDRDNNLLGNFSAPGTASLALDNSALFLGALSDTANISRLEFSSSVPNRAIGINALSLRAVPEPSGVAGLVLTGLGLLVMRKRKTLSGQR
ncbi:hypothetical protein C1752_00233 [Acaryochloris thomasi RCC1774]|uniref:PEP-CTERM protein-sorting domain-containing protein n=1 Tax=Acaryochloris thomasi RCC1774 TaxID=1764569 RepID=A0A2W1K190_9CYAN|nr:PEP-CTERM sorting domain-containing protein [Acaryochloris thomasi]PZD75244.1 hypothetical protein C1752_00233 [Acaryochloris thomasi RCC1774]